MTNGPTLEGIADRIVQIDERRRFPYETIVRFGRHFPEADRGFFLAMFEHTIGSRLYEVRDVVYDTEYGMIYHDGAPLADLPLDDETRAGLTGVDPDRLERVTTDSTVILGVHRNSGGYHHWLMTDVPALACAVRHAPAGALLLLPPLRPFQRAYLDMLGLAHMPRLEVQPRRQYLLPRALITDFHLIHNIFQISGAAMQVFAELRRRAPRAETPKRVYISRGAAWHRRVLNEDALLPLLARYGYTPVRLEELSLPMQMNVFRNARCIVAPHGAGLTNLCFGNPGAHIFEMLTQGWVNACFNVMAKAARMHYWADVYPGAAGMAPISADIDVDLESFAEILDGIEAHVAAAADLDTMYGIS